MQRRAIPAGRFAVDPAGHLQILMFPGREVLSARPAGLRDDLRLVGVQLGRVDPGLL